MPLLEKHHWKVIGTMENNCCQSKGKFWKNLKAKGNKTQLAHASVNYVYLIMEKVASYFPFEPWSTTSQNLLPEFKLKA